MNNTEKRATLTLASIFAFRMLGLFMILPVFTLYAEHLRGATPLLIGVALGVYGLSQAALQVPFGMLSDRWGRKPIITLGLILFAIGSVVAALSHSIEGVIVGRALQGAGAVGSTLIALVADLTRDEHRTKAMATIGMTIGISFSIAMVLGPVLNGWVHVNGIFWLTAGLALGGIAMLHGGVPTPKRVIHHQDSGTVPALLGSVLRNPELLRLDIGIFIQHAILTATFIVLPVALAHSAGIVEAKQWMVYLPVLVLSFITMVPFIIIAEKKQKMKPVFLAAIACLGIAQLALWSFHSSVVGIFIALYVYFTGFNLLEASLPSLISKIAPVASKGTALGVYSTAQFFGIFVGGSLGGWLYGHHDLAGVFYMGAAFSLIWFLVAATMHKPKHLSSKMVTVGEMTEHEACALAASLQQLPGVAEAVVSQLEGTAYLKVDNTQFDEQALNKLI
jgi:MFS family permease